MLKLFSKTVSVAVAIFIPGVAFALPVVTINNPQPIIDPFYSSQPIIDPYYGIQPVIPQSIYGSQTVIVNPSRRTNTVIVSPSNGSQTVIVNQGKRSQTVIVNPNNSYPIFGQSNCSSMIMGSPIPSPVPMNTQTGRFC